MTHPNFDMPRKSEKPQPHILLEGRVVVYMTQTKLYKTLKGRIYDPTSIETKSQIRTTIKGNPITTFGNIYE